MTILAPYIRVSTRGQVREDTPELQKQCITDYATRIGAELLPWYEDGGMSGADPNRPALTKMLKDIDQYDGVVVFDITRLVREEELGDMILHKLKRNHKKLHIALTGRTMDFSHGEEILNFKLYSWFADEERQRIRSRMEIGLAKYLNNGGKLGRKRKPINWGRVDELRAANISVAGIARLLNVGDTTLRRRIAEREKESW